MVFIIFNDGGSVVNKLSLIFVFMKTVSSTVAAEYLLSLAYKTKGVKLNVTQVQKLLYIAYGIAISKFDSFIVDEKPQAWPYGPVFPKTRSKVNYTSLTDLDDKRFDEIKSDSESPKVLDYVVDRFSRFKAGKLSSWSHSDGSPWDKTTKKEFFVWGEEISDDDIKEYFSKYNFDIPVNA